MPACYGAPVICLSSKYASDVFINGLHGYVMGSETRGISIDEYAGCIAELLMDERKAWKMGHEAWRLCNEHTWYRRAKELTKILERT